MKPAGVESAHKGHVVVDAVYTLDDVERRLGLGKSAICVARRRGFHGITTVPRCGGNLSGFSMPQESTWNAVRNTSTPQGAMSMGSTISGEQLPQ